MRTGGSPAASIAIRWVAGVQGVYFALTGLWPIIDIQSFMVVTGPKADVWLVQTVGALICVPAAVALRIAWRGRASRGEIIAVCGPAAVLGAVDVIFVARRTISIIYLVDAAIEAVMLAAWWFSLRALRGDREPVGQPPNGA